MKNENKALKINKLEGIDNAFWCFILVEFGQYTWANTQNKHGHKKNPEAPNVILRHIYMELMASLQWIWLDCTSL